MQQQTEQHFTSQQRQKQQDVIVLNCGSSSVKFAIIDAQTGATSVSGTAENLSNDNAVLNYKVADHKHSKPLPEKATHQDALTEIQAIIAAHDSQPFAVGHRVVHGGETFRQAAMVTNEVRQAIEQHAVMAPLHNPANLQGIDSAQQAFPNLPHVAVFDTAFFQTMPKHAYLYALPRELYENHGIRRYGFHGSSHQYVSEAAAVMLKKPKLSVNLITAHLGNGCSIAAIKDGVAVDTSLGFTPLEGLVMGTRCGDLDPSLPGILCQLLNKDIGEIDNMLNKSSGLLGISGKSNDCRRLENLAQQGDEHAVLALTVFSYRLAKYIASYFVATGPLDALVFTGGIGENSAFIRRTTLQMLQQLKLTIDEDKNLAARFGEAGNIASSGIPVLVIPTNEEWVIARQTCQLCNNEEG